MKITILLALILLFSQIHTAYAEENEKGKFVLVVIDRIGWRDIQDAEMPNLDRLMSQGAIGLMTTNTAGSRNQKNAYVTMGAGARAVGSSKSHLAFSADAFYKGEKVNDLFFQITGFHADPESIINLGYAQTIRNNQNRPYDVSIGALGTALEKGNKRTAVFGNCDTGEELERYLVSMMMNQYGLVPMGAIGSEILMEDPSRPFGIRTDYSKLKQLLDECWDEVDVAALQLGDTSRVEDFKYEATDERIESLRYVVLGEIDAFIGDLAAKLDMDKDRMLIICPLGSARQIRENNRLTPVIAVGKGVSKGWLTSGATHRRGVVTNLDIGATLLDFFGLPHMSGQMGSPIFSREPSDSVAQLIGFNDKLVQIYNQRNFLIRSYVSLQIIILLVALAVLLFMKKYLPQVKILLIYLMIVPLVYLLLTLFHQPTLAANILIALGLGAVMTALAMLGSRNTLDRMIIICGGIVLALLIDQWTGGRLIQGSPLGYDVIGGARFYGMGNEYMGILTGAACTLVGTLFQRLKMSKRNKSRIGVVIFMSVLVTLALPQLGANVGGTISAFFAFTLTWLLLMEHRISWKHGAAAAGILCLLLIGIFAADSLRVVDSQSHMGQTAALVQKNGVGEMVNIIERKIAMNIKLFKYTIWTKVLLTSLAVVAVLFYRPVGIFKDVLLKYRALSFGLMGATAASITALLVNDSGVVAAATAMVYVVPPLVLLIMDQVENKVKDGELFDGVN